jgi:phosphotriesterase-related protein
MTGLERFSRREFLRLTSGVVAGFGVAAGLAAGGCVPPDSSSGPAPRLITTLGPLALPQAGVILPHEHIFVDLRPPSDPEQGQAETADVLKLMQPELERARAAGVAVLVDAAPEGVGRRADIVAAVSRAAGLPVLVPTGLYRDAWIPAWARDSDEVKLRDWMIGELTGRIEDTDVQAGWIKLGGSDGGLTEQERKALRAAAGAGAATGAVIGSHIVRGRVAREALDLIEQAGYRADRFIWIHADQERDSTLHEELARRGAWIEFDSIGSGRDAAQVAMIQHMLDAGLGEHVLLSMDRGWYDPAQPGGGAPKPFTYLTETFLPRLEEVGIDEATIAQLTRENPFRAFARTA